MLISRRRVLIATLAAAVGLMLQRPVLADSPWWMPSDGERNHADREREDGHGHGHEDRPHDRDDRPYRQDDGRYRAQREYGQSGSNYSGGDYHGYRGYHGDDWDNDYGVVRRGNCDTSAVLGVAGAVTGGIIGNQSASPHNRGVATIFGAVAGGIIGSALGRSIDESDRACIGESLELGRIGSPIDWRNPHSRVAWRVVPLRDVSPDCREFDLRRNYYGRYGHERVVACRRDRGDWAFRDR